MILPGQVAENLAESVTRGDRVLVHGTIGTEAWETDSGEQRSRDIVVVSERHGEIATSLRYATAPPVKTGRSAPEEGSGDNSGKPA